MRILFFGNNLVGYRILNWLKGQNEKIVGLVLHPENRQKYGREIAEISGLSPNYIFFADQLEQDNTLSEIHNLQADIGLSIFFGYILQPRLFEMLPKGCLNLHPALLPYNRGSFPNVWSIIDKTPAGVTLHYVDKGIDTGDIVAQKEVLVLPTDTGESLYQRLEDSCFDLFIESWGKLWTGEIPPQTQDFADGTYHFMKDVDDIDYIDLEKAYVAQDLIDIIRARTFPPYHGAYIVVNGQRIFLRLHLEYETSFEEGESR